MNDPAKKYVTDELTFLMACGVRVLNFSLLFLEEHFCGIAHFFAPLAFLGNGPTSPTTMELDKYFENVTYGKKKFFRHFHHL
jgi:hypothetical protein